MALRTPSSSTGQPARSMPRSDPTPSQRRACCRATTKTPTASPPRVTTAPPSPTRCSTTAARWTPASSPSGSATHAILARPSPAIASAPSTRSRSSSRVATWMPRSTVPATAASTGPGPAASAWVPPATRSLAASPSTAIPTSRASRSAPRSSRHHPRTAVLGLDPLRRFRQRPGAGHLRHHDADLRPLRARGGGSAPRWRRPCATLTLARPITWIARAPDLVCSAPDEGDVTCALACP